MARKSRVSALETLSPAGRASILAALLQAHPGLVAEAEGLAARSLHSEGRYAVSGDGIGARAAAQEIGLVCCWVCTPVVVRTTTNSS